jgi:hypothetical protein
LLEWCLSITRNYKKLNIDDFNSNSWYTGFALVAIFHHCYPNDEGFKAFDYLYDDTNPLYNYAKLKQACRLGFILF